MCHTHIAWGFECMIMIHNVGFEHAILSLTVMFPAHNSSGYYVSGWTILVCACVVWTEKKDYLRPKNYIKLKTNIMWYNHTTRAFTCKVMTHSVGFRLWVGLSMPTSSYLITLSPTRGWRGCYMCMWVYNVICVLGTCGRCVCGWTTLLVWTCVI